VRDKLRVLWTPRAACRRRTWCNTVEVDRASTVHFTILRPPESRTAREHRASLIAFRRANCSSRNQRVSAIILDRYSRQGVLPIAYFDNIASFLLGGRRRGAELGPGHYASATSSGARRSIRCCRPSRPASREGVRGGLSETGKRHR